MRKTNFNEKGNFYKGNCHCHTTNSDGRLEPNIIIPAYKDKGYNFLMVTDHNLYSNYNEYNEENFITIQGFEGNVNNFHFIFFPTTANEPFGHLEAIPSVSNEEIEAHGTHKSVNEYVKNICSRGYAAMINHPYWSAIEYDDIMKLENIFAVEVYNYGCEIGEDTSESITHWDACLKKGKKLWAMATDDNHNIHPLYSKNSDSFGGWVMVKAKSLNEKDIVEAMLNGSFYASQGPEIYDFYVEDGYCYLECSEVARVNLHGYKQGDFLNTFYWEDCSGKKGIVKCKFQLKGNENYIKAQIYDVCSKKAYTNPIYLD
ncbi:MAG: CehA/McbA family metallohydrolase [Lachnospirales bacterium]